MKVEGGIYFILYPSSFILSSRFGRAKWGAGGALHLQSALAELNSRAPARCCGAARPTGR